MNSKTIQSRILHKAFRMKFFLKYLMSRIKIIGNSKKLHINYDESIIFLLACDYNNIGDVLIRNSQEKFISNCIENKKIITINYGETFKYLKDIAKCSTKNTIVVLTGGGNIGDKYTGIEQARNIVIRQLARSNCKVISFPQTIDYSKTKKGKFYLSKAQKAYASNKNFFLVTRERVSYNFAKKTFPNTHTILTPDIVLSFKPDIQPRERNGIGLLIRNDDEKKLSDDFLKKIVSKLKKEGIAVEENDMTVNGFDKTKIYDYIQQKLAFASNKKLVITDRLHGMILCYITNTPCLVFRNSNHKISETFHNWLEGTQNFIILENDQNDEKTLTDIKKLSEIKVTNKQDLSSRYLKLVELIKG